MNLQVNIFSQIKGKHLKNIKSTELSGKHFYRICQVNYTLQVKENISRISIKQELEGK